MQLTCDTPISFLIIYVSILLLQLRVYESPAVVYLVALTSRRLLLWHSCVVSLEGSYLCCWAPTQVGTIRAPPPPVLRPPQEEEK